MKTTLLILLTVAFNIAAQERPPIQILPGLAPPPIPVEPREIFPEDMEPPDGQIFPGDMFIPDMPGRYQIISAQIQQNGKAAPIVLKLDTQTGQVWQMKSITATVFRNGKPHPFTRLIFEPVDAGDHPQPLPRVDPARDRPNVIREQPQPNVAPRR